MSIKLHRKFGVFFDANRTVFRKFFLLFTYFYLSALLTSKFISGKSSPFTTYNEITFFIATLVFSGIITLKHDGYFD
ncbi:MAG TPA: hypothetical protein PK466_14890 [Thermotogota bacterium]|nr:hypothetical protein [Thermotogota bacterium]HPJ90299.1 hypothetical protein [Thermotogota bacterium]HPR97616.1 hypothetical protein [Thermotogota bacterium]